jgi:hypothetical protein
VRFSGASPAQLSHAAHAASSAVRPRLSFHALLLAEIMRFGALRNISRRAGRRPPFVPDCLISDCKVWLLLGTCLVSFEELILN